ncbi:hypothetical protein [Marilutibacter spongiae]|uniref:Uncharacterized protein n=1 Tax=Marilutibacter spongiae TaxID=2025720 RepID=A0A7W3TM91_9GAMM|nr:hypothetical protein [Lysobacter spongiae]MBB1060756.1 hypothetical protein [Lysobacter spongiae]
MSPSEDEDTCVATVEDARPRDLPGCGFLLVLVLLFHASMSFNLALASGFVLGVFYAFLPPVAAKVVATLALSTCPVFAGTSLLVWLALLLAMLRARKVLRRATRDRWPTGAIALCLPILLTWSLLASGEAVRTIAMHRALHEARPDCHATRTLWSSLHEWSDGFGHRQAHAWFVKHGVRFLWSYRKMAFVPDTRPWLNGGRCRQSGGTRLPAASGARRSVDPAPPPAA